MKKRVLFIAKIIVFLLCFFVIMCLFNRTLKDKNNYSKYLKFYEEKEPYDILFFGSSRMLDCIQPLELYQDYGITSYNMAAHSENMNITYWQMKNAFKYNTPKVAVIDISLYSSEVITDNSDSEDKGYLHKSLDHMPISLIKYEAVKDLTDDYSHYDYLFPFEIYHNRWNEIVANDIIISQSGKKGAESRIDYQYLEKDDKECSPSTIVDVAGTTYVDEIIEICDINGVIPVFIILPSQIINLDVIYSFEQFFAENGIAFYNLNRDENVLNYHTDFADESHVNPGGGRKITKMLGKVITDAYTFPEKESKTIDRWDYANYEYIAAAKKGDIIHSKDYDTNTFLALLVCEDDYKIKITETSDQPFLNNYGEFLDEIYISDEDYIVDPLANEAKISIYEEGINEPFCEKIFE